MRYIILRYRTSKSTKTEFWEFPEDLNDKILLSAISKVYDVDGIATIEWFEKPSRHALKTLAYAFDPFDLVHRINFNHYTGQEYAPPNDAIDIKFKTKNGFEFRPKKLDFTVSEWNELFKLWESYKITNKKTPKEKEHSLKCLDLIETMNQDDFLNQIAIHDILT